MITNNICTPLGLVNGAMGVMHSLLPANKDDAARLASASGYMQVLLTEPPAGVSVVLTSTSKTISVGSLGQTDSGLPIVPLRHHASVERSLGSAHFTLRTVPLTLAFALTIHKCQGQTLARVIVALWPKKHLNTLDRRAVLVALSRVRALAHVRLLERLPSDKLTDKIMKRWLKSLNSKSSFDESVEKFMSMFVANSTEFLRVFSPSKMNSK